MTDLRRLCLVVAAGLALVCGFVSPSRAQSGDVEELNKQVIALYQAGKYAEAVPLAQQVLAITPPAGAAPSPALVCVS